MPSTLLLLLLTLLTPLITTIGSGRHPPHITPPFDPCTTPLTHLSSPNFDFQSPTHSFIAGYTSTGELCCRLCHEAHTDCLFAHWVAKTFSCSVTLNHEEGTPGEQERQDEWARRNITLEEGFEEARERLNTTDACPNGIRGEKRYMKGKVHRGEWERGIIAGPCWAGGYGDYKRIGEISGP